MMRKLLSVFVLLISISFAVKAQKATSEEKATQQADIITKYINSKLTDATQHLNADQTGKIKQAYLDYYNDKVAYKARKKAFLATYKTWKAATKETVSAERAAELKEQKKEIAKENAALNKETKDMVTRREDKITEALTEAQKPIFTAMREEQSKGDDSDSK